MSLYDYRESQKIAAFDFPFYSLIMAAMRQADSENIEKLKREFPAVWQEFSARYNAPGGILEGEQDRYY
jgi:hypothetical protein